MTVGAIALKRLKLANVRAQCQLTQKQLAEQAHLSRTTVHFAEHNLPISRISAYSILKVLNPIRQDIGLPTLDIGDINWTIQGEGRTHKT
jgi:DNA-binding XRE family transcriptional regulator